MSSLLDFTNDQARGDRLPAVIWLLLRAGEGSKEKSPRPSSSDAQTPPSARQRL